MEQKIALLNLGKESYDLALNAETLISNLTMTIRRAMLENKLLKEKLHFYEENSIESTCDTTGICQKLKCNLNALNDKLSEKNVAIKPSSRRTKQPEVQNPMRSKSVPSSNIRSSDRRCHSRSSSSESVSRSKSMIRAWK